MTKFLSTPLVRTLTAIAVFISTINAIDLRGRLPDAAVISNMLSQENGGSYIKSFDTATDSHDKKRKLHKADVESIIKKKIKKLKPELDEQKELSSDPDDDEQRSVIEFSPFSGSKRDMNSSGPENVKDVIKKYKKLRREIENALKKESVSVNSKHLVTRTLDRLISQMIGSQCNLRNDDNNVPVDRAQGSVLKVDKATMLQSWTNKWQDLITQYSISSQDSEPGAGAGYKEMFLFLIRLREFFFQIHDELNMLNDRYMVKCQLMEKIPKTSKEHTTLRYHTTKGKYICDYIKICSDELRNFMMDFYVSLKETVDTVFKDYLEMYKRDITTDTSDERRWFIKILEDMNEDVITEVDKSFQEETINMDLEQNRTMDKYTNLKNFILTTVNKVQKTTEKVIQIHLKSLEDTLRKTVTEDLLYSIDIELKSFQTQKIEKMCSMFQTCNGNSTRRMNFHPKDRFSFGKNNINVKLKIGFDDLPSFRKKAKKQRRAFTDKVNKRYQRSSPHPPFDLRKYAHVKVTRTKLTTKSDEPSTTKPTTTKRTTVSTTQSKAIVAKKSTYTYADHVKKMIRLTKIITKSTKTSSTTTGPTTTSSYLQHIQKLKADGKIKIRQPDFVKRSGYSHNSIQSLFDI